MRAPDRSLFVGEHFLQVGRTGLGDARSPTGRFAHEPASANERLEQGSAECPSTVVATLAPAPAHPCQRPAALRELDQVDTQSGEELDASGQEDRGGCLQAEQAAFDETVVQVDGMSRFEDPSGRPVGQTVVPAPALAFGGQNLPVDGPGQWDWRYTTAHQRSAPGRERGCHPRDRLREQQHKTPGDANVEFHRVVGEQAGAGRR